MISFFEFASTTFLVILSMAILRFVGLVLFLKVDFFLNPSFVLFIRSFVYFLTSFIVFVLSGEKHLWGVLIVWVFLQGSDLQQHLSRRTTSSYSMSDRKTQVLFNRSLVLLPLCVLLGYLSNLGFSTEPLLTFEVVFAPIRYLLYGISVFFLFLCTSLIWSHQKTLIDLLKRSH